MNNDTYLKRLKYIDVDFSTIYAVGVINEFKSHFESNPDVIEYFFKNWQTYHESLENFLNVLWASDNTNDEGINWYILIGILKSKNTATLNDAILNFIDHCAYNDEIDISFLLNINITPTYLNVYAKELAETYKENTKIVYRSQDF